MAIIYISGPMTGFDDHNRNSFMLAEVALQAQGHEVRNPACLPAGWSSYEDYMEIDLVMLRQCDAIVCLPGWENSPGATRELASAKKWGIPVRTEMLAEVWHALNVTYIANKQGDA